MAKRKRIQQIYPKVNTPRGVGYVEGCNKTHFMVKYIMEDLEEGLVKEEFIGPCIFRMESREEVKFVED